jgi:hypothetical protein
MDHKTISLEFASRQHIIIRNHYIIHGNDR